MSRNFGELKAFIATTNLGRSDAATLVMAGYAINWLLVEHLPQRRLKPFLKNDDLSTTENVEYVALPSDFASLKIARVLQSDATSYLTMSDMEWEDLELGTDDTGEPSNKMVLPTTDGWRLYMREIPDDTYTINIWYYARQTELTADATTPLLSTIYGDAPIISGATWRLAANLGIDKEATKWKGIFDKVDLPELLSWQAHVDGYKAFKPIKNPYGGY